MQFFAEARKGFRTKGIEYYDNEYSRNGTACIFLFTEPLKWFCHVDVQEQRTKTDWAYRTDRLLNEQYPEALKVILLLDNFIIHTVALLYEAFPTDKAFNLASRFEIYYTPKHDSWLDITGIELSALGKQYLETRHFPDHETLHNVLRPWFVDRKKNQKGVDWQFSKENARNKLKHLYLLLNF